MKRINRLMGVVPGNKHREDMAIFILAFRAHLFISKAPRPDRRFSIIWYIFGRVLLGRG